MAKQRKRLERCSVGISAKGITIQLPGSDDVSPVYSRRQVASIVADLQAALDDDMGVLLLR